MESIRFFFFFFNIVQTRVHISFQVPAYPPATVTRYCNIRARKIWEISRDTGWSTARAYDAIWSMRRRRVNGALPLCNLLHQRGCTNERCQGRCTNEHGAQHRRDAVRSGLSSPSSTISLVCADTSYAKIHLRATRVSRRATPAWVASSPHLIIEVNIISKHTRSALDAPYLHFHYIFIFTHSGAPSFHFLSHIIYILNAIVFARISSR